jgi:hypothetical protein
MGAGEMSKRTEALRPGINLAPKEAAEARRLRRLGHQIDQIAAKLQAPHEEVEKALCQMRMPRPETTRGTLNITLAAHAAVARERRGNEPLWLVFDRMLDELFVLREKSSKATPAAPPSKKSPFLPLFDRMNASHWSISQLGIAPNGSMPVIAPISRFGCEGVALALKKRSVKPPLFL